MDKKRKTVIVTDSSCDLSDGQLSRYGIRMISLRVVCQNAEYRDRIDIQEDELYDLLTRELPKTHPAAARGRNPAVRNARGGGSGERNSYLHFFGAERNL